MKFSDAIRTNKIIENQLRIDRHNTCGSIAALKARPQGYDKIY